jgi:hypothetical protein
MICQGEIWCQVNSERPGRVSVWNFDVYLAFLAFTDQVGKSNHKQQPTSPSPSHAYKSIVFLTVHRLAHWIPASFAVVGKSDQDFCVHHIGLSSKEHVKSQFGWIGR